MRRRILTLLIIVLFSGYTGAAYCQQAAQTSYQARLQQLSDLVHKHFYNPKQLPEFEKTYQKYQASLPAVKNELEFANLANAMLSELNASHTYYYSKAEPEFYQLASIFYGVPAIKKLFNEGPVQYPSLGFTTRNIDGKRFILWVLQGSPAHKAGLLAGDEILTMNGFSFSPSTIIAGGPGKTYVLKVHRNPEGEPFSVSVKAEQIDPKDEFLRAERGSIRIIEKNGRKIGYIHIWNYAGEHYHKVLVDALTSGPLRNADALIWDLRDGWGGASPVYLGLFTDKIPVTELIDNKGKIYRMDDPKKKPTPIWKKPVVMLINERSRSGKEILAYGFKKYKVGQVIGERTQGAVLAGTAFLTLDNNMLFLAVTDVKVDGERLEAIGVEPDIRVPFDIRYAAGKDPQLDKAVEVLGK